MSRMMKETQATIACWAALVSQPTPSYYRICVQAQEELVEALRAHSSGDHVFDVVAKLADTAIVLYRFADLIGFDGDAAAISQYLRPRGLTTPGSILTVCNQLLAALTATVHKGSLLQTERGLVNRILGQLIGSLYFLAEVFGQNLTSEINQRMAANRARSAVGTGYRVRIPEIVGGISPSDG
jgi:hypothetical protein